MLSDQAYEALTALEHGATVTGDAARELVVAGLAQDDWGSLRISEAGRRVARGHAAQAAKYQPFGPDDENVADLWMGNPARNRDITPPSLAIPPDDPMAEDPPPPEPTLPPALPPDNYVRGLRAAGVATGKTGKVVDTSWVLEFIDAWNDYES